VAACRVSVTDPSGIEHGVEVSAESLFEAAALAVVEFHNAGRAESFIGQTTVVLVNLDIIDKARVLLLPSVPRMVRKLERLRNRKM
jgi:hypothetical protein